MAFQTLFVIIKLVAAGELAMVFSATVAGQVGLLMDLEIVGRAEPLGAAGTLVGLFTSVDFLVSLEV